MRERELPEAKNILYKADRLSLTIICSRIPVSETTQLRLYLLFEQSDGEDV